MSKGKRHNWKGFIEDILISKNQFSIHSNKIKGEFEEVIYSAPGEDVKASFIVSYFFRTGSLIAYRYHHPSARGYNEFSKNEYFFSLQFVRPMNYENPGLPYTVEHKKELQRDLKKGVLGKEVQYVKNNIVIKSELFLQEDKDVHVYKYRFTKSPMIDILINKGTNNDVDLLEKTTDLQDVFPGLLVE